MSPAREHEMTEPTTSAPAGPSGLPAWLGRRVLVQQIGGGGMGEVFLAMQASASRGIERMCVAKIVQARHVGNPGILARFVDEARTSLLLHHQNLCMTYDLEEVGGMLVLSMEYIGGHDLRAVFDVVSKEGQGVAVDEGVAFGCDFLAGLHHAHEVVDPRSGLPLGLVHRDVSPHNVMIGYDGVAKVIDFGIARSRLQISQTESGALIGKIHYMPPEQVNGTGIDRRVDVFAAGVVLTELCSGKRFYERPADVLGFLDGSNYRSPALDAAPEVLRPILEGALDRSPERRYPTAAAFAAALRTAAPSSSSSTLVAMMKRLFPLGAAQERQRVQDHYRSVEAFLQRSSSPSDPWSPPLSDLTTLPTAITRPPSLPLPLALEVTVRAAIAARSTEEAPEDSAAAFAGPAAGAARLPTRPAVGTSTGSGPTQVVRTRAAAFSPATLPVLEPGRAPALGVAALVVAVVVVVVIAVVATRPIEVARPETTAPRTALVTASVVPPPIVAEPVVDAGSAEAVDVDAVAVSSRPPVARARVVLPPRPERLGERIAYLKQHCARAACSTSIQARAVSIGRASAEEIKTLRDDVERCLGRCGAPL
ncbi:MAG: serine/threonine-protein kinase [Deltaproteobacteria bacterium]|nr:serine/threonine-protein kinase [Deltaproteobacteria bacterium]